MKQTEESAEDTKVYKVVANQEGQYTIWPVARENPPGWQDAGKSGPKADCLDHIKTVWTDMRPLSLRRSMEELAGQQKSEPSACDAPEASITSESLVERLSRGVHPVEVTRCGARTAEAFQKRIDFGYIHLKFTGTAGGTEIGCRLLRDSAGLTGASLAPATDTVHLVGSLNLDYVDVQCIADIDMSTLTGTGRLQTVDSSGR